MVEYSQILQNLEFINISNDEFTIFEWKPPRSYKSFILDLNIVKQNPASNIFFHISKGNMKIVHIRINNLIYTAGSNNKVQFQLLEALIEKVSIEFNIKYDIESCISYGNFSTAVFNSFNKNIEDIIAGFNELDTVKELKVPLDEGEEDPDFLKLIGKRTRGGITPHPYISTPPKPPDDFAAATHVQVRAPLNERDPEGDVNCQYCGKKLTEDEQITHSCKKKPKKP